MPAAYPLKGPPGSDRDLLMSDLFKDGVRGRVVLGYDEGILVTGLANHYMARAVVAAANDWTAGEWLNTDDRLFGLILISSSIPAEAAAEIRRCGQNPRFVGVAMGVNVLSRPFGHPIYYPIYDACVELGLPVVIQVGSEGDPEQVTPPIAGGLPATYAEYRALSSQGHMSHLVSMLIQGVFERFPKLRVLLVGGGAAWLPGWLWRVDYFYKTADQEAPWLRQLPSDYFREHVRVSTGSLETPADPAHLATALRTFPGFDRILMYTSCYPNADSESPDEVAKRLPAEWHGHVFRENALDFYRWPARAMDPAAEPTTDFGETPSATAREPKEA
jgi:predicted TIM-barrel fold metal-dependent hydrolase